MCKVGSSPVITTLACLLRESDAPWGSWCCLFAFFTPCRKFSCFPSDRRLFLTMKFLTGDCSPFNVILPVQSCCFVIVLLLLLLLT